MRYYSVCREDIFGTFSLTGLNKFLHRMSISLPDSSLSFKIALVLRKLVFLNRVQVVDTVSLYGFKMRLYPLDNVGDRLALFMPWSFESEEFRLLQKYFFAGGVFLDIGANTGYYSLLASLIAGKGGRVIAVEPYKVMFDRMVFNIRNNRLEDRIESLNLGLADNRGQFKLSLYPKNLGQSSIVQSYGEKDTLIDCITFMDLIEENGISQIDFLKIDVELAEPLILNPFFEKAHRSLWPKFVLIETPQGIPFSELGYREIIKTKNNTIYQLI